MTTVLVVEDDVDINNLIQSHLATEGYTVVQAFDGPAALEAVEADNPDLIILDWMLPGLDGLSVAQRVRRAHLTPIIMLTARGEEIDRVVGLEIGADDYVVKPFGMRELLARVRATLRRVEMTAPPQTADGGRTGVETEAPDAAEPIVHGTLRIDLAGRVVTVGGEEVPLTRREFDLLVLLASNPGRAFSRAYLLEHLWKDDFEVVDRVVDNYVVRLRKKLGAESEWIITIWGVGYRFAR